MNESYKNIINKLDRFIRKYYYDMLMKGIIITMICGLAMVMIVSIINLLGQFESVARTYIFYIMLGIFISVFILFIIIPIVKIIKVARRISYKTASIIISKFFSEIQDKLINVLELKEELNTNTLSNNLLLASIEEKTERIKIFDYNIAIDFRKNVKILIYFIGLFSLSAILVAMFPDIVLKGTGPIIYYDRNFENEKIINIELLNDYLSVKRGYDFELKISAIGLEKEENIYIEYGGRSFLMNQYNNNSYSYLFRSLNNNLAIKLISGERILERYDISVLPGPSMLDYIIMVKAPEYTLEEHREYSDVGDIIVNTGSEIKWIINAHNAETTEFVDGENIKYLKKNVEGAFTTDTVLYEDYIYEISVSNKHFIRENPMLFTVEVIPDMFPGIYIDCLNDTIMESDKIFKGKIEDDYGFSSLEFVYLDNENNNNEKRLKLLINKNILEQDVYYSYDLKNTGLKKIAYYFEVKDNDAVNGEKSSRSKTFYFEFPDEKEIFEQTSKTYENNEDKIRESKKLTKEILDEINKVREFKLNEGGSEWEIEHLIEDIFEKNQKLENLVNEITEGERNKNKYLSDFTEQDESIMQKQEEIQELLENLIDDDLKKLLNELDKLTREKNRNLYQDVFKEIEISYEELSEQMDYNIELLKRMEVEQKLGMIEKMIDKLGEEQMELAEKIENNSIAPGMDIEKQEEIKEKYDNIMNELNKTEMLNEKIKNNFNISDLEKNKKNIENNFNEIKDNIEKKSEKKKSSENMKKNSGDLKEMAEKMRNLMKEKNMEKVIFDAENLRGILENLVEFSFDQEDNIYNIEGITPDDPKMEEIIGFQNSIKENFAIVEDSLNSLGRSTPELGSIISDEMKRIKIGFSRVDQSFNLTNNSMVKLEQQHIMTSANNIGLILSELLKKWQDMINKEQGGNCENQQGGSGKSQIRNMINGQEGLEEQIKRMIEELKDGKGNNPGKMNEGLGKMIAEQEIMKKMIQDIMSKGGIGSETKRMLEDVQRAMDQVKNDIINKNLNQNTLKRQVRLIEKLLEAEKAEMERDLEEIRESRRGENDLFSNPVESLEYKEIIEEFSDIFKRQGIKLNNYYKKRYREYIRRINEK